MTRRLPVNIIVAIAVAVRCGLEPAKLLDDPGYRPSGEGDTEKSFRSRLGRTSITVFPTVVRSFRAVVPMTVVSPAPDNQRGCACKDLLVATRLLMDPE